MFVKPFNGHLKKLCQIVILGTSLIFCQKAYGIVLIPGDPKFPGPSDPPKFTHVTYLLICEGIRDNPYTLTISVNSNDAKSAKALKIKNAFEALKLPKKDCPATLDLITDEIIFGKGIVLVKRTAGDDSGQEDKIETGDGTKNPHKPRKITIDTQVKVENISFGFDPDGNESLFSASFTFSNGINTFTADSSFPARDLNEPTANGLLTQIYGDFLADLPSDLDPYLSIDLFTNEINFNFPDNVVFASVQTVSTDQKLGISQSLEVRPIPEPTSTLSLLALGTLGAVSTLKRKLKPSQSTEKETTKVG